MNCLKQYLKILRREEHGKDDKNDDCPGNRKVFR